MPRRALRFITEPYTLRAFRQNNPYNVPCSIREAYTPPSRPKRYVLIQMHTRNILPIVLYHMYANPEP
jgi:hypothetical protein